MESKERAVLGLFWKFLPLLIFFVATVHLAAQATTTFTFPNITFNLPVVIKLDHRYFPWSVSYNVFYKSTYTSPTFTYNYRYNPSLRLFYQGSSDDSSGNMFYFNPGTTYPASATPVQNPYTASDNESPATPLNGGYAITGPTAYYAFAMIPVSLPPTFTLSSFPSSSTWTKATSFHISLNNINDPQAPFSASSDSIAPGVDYSSASYQIDGGPWISGASFATNGIDITGLTDGSHTVNVTLADLVGNVSPPVSITLMVDNEPPVGPTNILLSLQNSANPTKMNSRQILASWTGISDSKAAVADLLVYVDPGTGSFGPPSVLDPNQQSLPIPIQNQNVSLNYRVAVIPVDALGNQVTLAQAPVSSIVVPPLLALTSATYDSADSNSQSMDVELVFNLTPKQASSLGSTFQVSRTSSSSGPTLPILTLDPSTIPTNISSSSLPWRLSGNNIAYVDTIQVSSGAGHKSWLYTEVSSLVTGIVSDGYTVTLPSNPAIISSISVIDSNNIASGQDSFGINASRIFTIQFQANDPDQDNLTYEIDSLSGYQDPNVSLTTGVNLTGPTLQNYPYSNGYAIQKSSVTLSEGDNYVQVKCSKGLDQNGVAIIFSSDILDIKLKKNSINGYYVFVQDEGQNIPTDNSIIITRPGQLLSFNIAPTSSSQTELIFNWNYNDPNYNTTDSGSSVTHAYAQVSGQYSSEVDHSLVVSVFSSGVLLSTVSLTVKVVDTQEGSLIVSETWTGPHTVVGVVTVPSSLALQVTPNTAVTFQGDLADGFGQGISAAGQLSVGDDATFSATAGQSQGWGTILVTGTAVIGAATIQNANHGLTVTNSGNTILKGTVVQENRIGIDIVGNGLGAASQPVLSISGANVTGNTVYGIKEDAGARPSLSGTNISTNFRNYYSFDRGLLNISQINSLNSQAAVINTGDANWGLDNAQ